VQEADAFRRAPLQQLPLLLTLSDRVAHFASSISVQRLARAENAVVTQAAALGVMAHEYVHSWNGKYRRPAGSATPDFSSDGRRAALGVRGD